MGLLGMRKIGGQNQVRRRLSEDHGGNQGACRIRNLSDKLLELAPPHPHRPDNGAVIFASVRYRPSAQISGRPVRGAGAEPQGHGDRPGKRLIRNRQEGLSSCLCYGIPISGPSRVLIFSINVANSAPVTIVSIPVQMVLMIPRFGSGLANWT